MYRSCIGQVSVVNRSSIGQVSVMYRSSIGHVSVKYRSSMINIVSFVIDLIIVLATGQDLLAEHTGVDTGSLYGGVFAGIIILAFAIINIALIIR